MKTIDARGQKCPLPLIMTKKALQESEENETLEILIDNETSYKNVCRFLEEHQLKVQTEMKDSVFRLKVNKTGIIAEETNIEAYCEIPKGSTIGYAIAFMSNTMGHGSDELGALLIKAFINTLPEADRKPGSLLFLNSGIFLALRDSPVLSTLLKLEKEGIKILVCGTCLDYYQKKPDLGVGIISNMYDILNTMSKAEKVLQP